MIEIQNLNMVYPNGVKALKDINLTIERSEFVFVVGASGAGKSTLIRLMGREFLPTSGSIRVFNKDITRLRRREVPYYRRKIGVVFQDFRLLENRTVLRMWPLLCRWWALPKANPAAGTGSAGNG